MSARRGDSDGGVYRSRSRAAFPAWGQADVAAVAKAVGDAYSEPAKDVEGAIAYVKGQKK